jgi:nitroreductase
MRYFFVLLLLSGLIVGFLWWYRRATDQRSDHLRELLRQLRAQYEHFMKQRLTLAYIREDDWQDERQKLVAEALEILKPNLDALAAQVSNGQFWVRELPLDDAVFSNVAAEAQAMAQQRGLARPEAREELYRAFSEAMRADLAHRWLTYQTGDRLSPI